MIKHARIFLLSSTRERHRRAVISLNVSFPVKIGLKNVQIGYSPPIKWCPIVHRLIFLFSLFFSTTSLKMMRAQKRSTTLIVMFLFQRCACLPVLDPSKAAMASTRTLSGKTPLRNLVSAELSSSSGSEDDSAIEPVKVPVAKRGGEYIRSTSPSASNVCLCYGF